MINELIVDDMVEFILSVVEDEKQQEEKYNELENYVINKAMEVKSKLKYCNGIYYPVEELKKMINEKNNIIESFIIDQLKMHGLEYYKMELYRVAV